MVKFLFFSAVSFSQNVAQRPAAWRWRGQLSHDLKLFTDFTDTKSTLNSTP
ncbi:hypothetical protein KU06112801_1750003 [Flavobacterium psychrophilum]|nr:hypothetical protein KU06112801_1750003 [Flavobacterium psychrophilum]